MQTPPLNAGLADLAERYDGFLLDSWGVLQDGIAPLPGANECLTRLRERGKRLIILSNSARRSAIVAGELARVGLAMDCIAQVITGGEAAWQALQQRPDAAHRALGSKCFYLGAQRSRSLLDGLELEITASIETASFILCTSPPDGSISDAVQAQLARAAGRGLTMLCANPDLVAHHGDEKRFCAGEVARLYQGLGGQVIYHGKPHLPFYERALKALGGISTGRILAVGDAFATDMAGADRAGIDALFVMGGIHRDRLSNPDTRAAELASLCDESNLQPIGAVMRFSWQG